MEKWRTICRWIGGAALASTVFYATADLGWWAPVVGDDPRGMLIFLLHLLGLTAGGLSFIPWLWQPTSSS